MIGTAGHALGRLIAAARNFTMPEAVMLGGEGVQLATAAQDELQADLQADRHPSAAPPPIVLQDPSFTQWARGSAVIAIQTFVLGHQLVTDYSGINSYPDVMDQLVRRWQLGWGLCRGLAPAEERDGALAVKLRLPGRDHELFTLTDRTEVVSTLAAEVASATEPTWLTVTTHRPDAVAAVLGGAGLKLFPAPSLLMSVELENHPPAATPAEYGLEVSGDGSLEYARVIDAQGNIAAGGMAAVVGADAVMHDISTDPAHRRRGLGSAVMAALSRRAIDRGAAIGLLMATTDGGYLYSNIGWSTEAPMLTATTPS